jgi:hypothetical protein
MVVRFITTYAISVCLKISPRQIQKIVSRAAELQERAPEFLDLLGMIVKVVGTDLTLKRNRKMIKIQTCLPVTCLEHMPISCNSALYISLQMLGFALMSSLFPQLLQSCIIRSMRI